MSTRRRNLSHTTDVQREADVTVETDGLSWSQLSRLTDAEREVWVSVEEEGLRPSELEKYTKWSASTIRTLLSRARSKLEK